MSFIILTEAEFTINVALNLIATTNFPWRPSLLCQLAVDGQKYLDTRIPILWHKNEDLPDSWQDAIHLKHVQKARNPRERLYSQRCIMARSDWLMCSNAFWKLETWWGSGYYYCTCSVAGNHETNSRWWTFSANAPKSEFIIFLKRVKKKTNEIEEKSLLHLSTCVLGGIFETRNGCLSCLIFPCRRWTMRSFVVTRTTLDKDVQLPPLLPARPGVMAAVFDGGGTMDGRSSSSSSNCQPHTCIKVSSGRPAEGPANSGDKHRLTDDVLNNRSALTPITWWQDGKGFILFVCVCVCVLVGHCMLYDVIAIFTEEWPQSIAHCF